MDQTLAQIYGTNQPTEADLQKLAAAEMVEGLAGDGIDLDNLTEEQYEALANEVLSDNSAQDPADAEKTAEAEAQEKIAEADQMGRIMAHAYVQELRNIEKTAEEAAAAPSSETPAQESAEHKPGKLRRAASAVGGAAKAVGHHVAANKKKYIGAAATTAAMLAAAKSKPGSRAIRGVVSARKGGLGWGESLRRGAAEGMERTASAMDTLVAQRMENILAENGIDPSVLYAEEKTASAEDVVGNEVERRAWEALKEMGLAE